MPDLQRMFSDLIRFEIELWDAIDGRLRTACDLSLSHFEPMRVMSCTDRCRVHDIADQLSITVGGTSKLVDRIEASGYCRRRANPTDRRSSIVELTPAGRRLLNDATRVIDDELQARLGSGVSERSLQQFCATLTKLRRANARIETEPPRLPS